VKRITYFIAGIALGLAVPATADVALKCAPEITPTWGEACAHDNALKSYFDHKGFIPNRCKIS
jgi:hypothetical protein